MFSLESILAGNHSLVFVLFGAYGAGILASLTPCIYPMIPITLGIINAQKSQSMLTSFLYSLSYALGIAAIYATLGYVSATSNIMFGQWLSHPIFVGFLIALFLYLAGTMFQLYPLYIPKFLSKKQSNQKGGSIISCFVFGLLTGAAASPCLTPALALLLGFAAKQGSPFIGFITLLAFALGMSTLLLIIGTFSGSLNALPRAGTWMLEVQKIFGFLLLTVCVYFLQPFFPEDMISLGYALILGGAGFYYLSHAKYSSSVRVMLVLGLGLTILSGFILYDAYTNRVERLTLEAEFEDDDLEDL